MEFGYFIQKVVSYSNDDYYFGKQYDYEINMEEYTIRYRLDLFTEPHIWVDMKNEWSLLQVNIK